MGFFFYLSLYFAPPGLAIKTFTIYCDMVLLSLVLRILSIWFKFCWPLSFFGANYQENLITDPLPHSAVWIDLILGFRHNVLIWSKPFSTPHVRLSWGRISEKNSKKNENQENRIENLFTLWIDFCDLSTIFRYGQNHFLLHMYDCHESIFLRKDCHDMQWKEWN